MRHDHSAVAVRGFTLVELIIVVAIIGILASIAVPQYTNYIRTSKMAEAKSNLLQIQTLMEQQYQDYRTYVTAPADPDTTAKVMSALPGWKPGTVASLHFEYSISGETASTYSAIAVGKTSAGLSGVTFSINQDNIKTGSW